MDTKYPVLVVLCLVVATSPGLASTPCGPDVPEEGFCDGPTRLVWCEDDLVKSYDCEPGAKCAWNEDLGAWDCLAGCGGVPAAGICVEDGTAVHYCEEGEIQVLYCSEGTSCGHNDEVGAMDCVKDRHPEYAPPSELDGPGVDGTEEPTAAPDEEPDSGKGADAGTSQIGSSDAGVPVPLKNEDSTPMSSAEPPVSKDEGGCSASPGGAGGGALALFGVLLLVAVRRRSGPAS